MIKDKLTYAENYYSISDNLKFGFEWLKKQDLTNIESGKYIIKDDLIYANVQEYLTKDNAKYEAHRKYIDIQYMISGREKVGVCDIKDCKTVDNYNNESDLEFLLSNCDDTWQILNEGEFLVLFPNDAHMPSVKIDTNKTVKKVVVKVALN